MSNYTRGMCSGTIIERSSCTRIRGTRERGVADDGAFSAALSANDGFTRQSKAMAPESGADLHDRLIFF